MPISYKHILPACAAVLVAAAFAFMCFFAPTAYAEDSATSTWADVHYQAVIDNFGLTSSEVHSAAMCQFFSGVWNYTVIIADAQITYNESNGYVSYSGRGYTLRDYVTGGSYYFESGNVGFSVWSDYVSYDGTRWYFDPSISGYYCVGLALPTRPSANPVIGSAYHAIYTLHNASGTYGYTATIPTSDTPVSISSIYSTHVKPAVEKGVVTTTTTTTTTTTITTTTTTGATLPPYPYETSPPFTLPDDWTADYSETTPTPSLPPVGTADISGYDSQISDAEKQLLPGIAFWFVLLGDFLLSVPGIIISAIVFCILIYLTITLLYHKGGD